LNGNETVSRLDFESTVDLLTAAVESSGLKIVAIINAQENLKKIGAEIGGNKILEVFHPKLAKEVFQKDIRAGIVPPLRIYVYEDAGVTHVATQSAVDLFSSYAGLQDLARKVDEMLESIVSKIQ
jgi:uncharacterized protein (DUF302 family)